MSLSAIFQPMPRSTATRAPAYVPVLMGLKPEFEPLRAQILNTSPMTSLQEAFAIVDGEDR